MPYIINIWNPLPLKYIYIFGRILKVTEGMALQCSATVPTYNYLKDLRSPTLAQLHGDQHTGCVQAPVQERVSFVGAEPSSLLQQQQLKPALGQTPGVLPFISTLFLWT